VINATGVVLHTNLGRAPLAAEAAEAAALAGSSYSNLEFEVATGARGRRHSHVEPALVELSGAEAALAVNNNAAAVLLALAALVGDREVIVARGQLIEIGGSFRIPEILAQSGARLVEVGTANRTRISDYEDAVGPKTGAVLRVHKSNFRTVGFTEEAGLDELCRFGQSSGLLIIDDLGSGAVRPIADEPDLSTSVKAGATIVCSSADKLLGGPQAGLLVGKAGAVERCRKHPLARALRIDKMQLAALETTLRLHRFGGPRAIPALAMLGLTSEELGVRAKRLTEAIGERATVASGVSAAGGGSLPGVEFNGPVCAIEPGIKGADWLATTLRKSDPPIVGRIGADRFILDPRTIGEDDLDLVGELTRAALSRE
jgi:L-seryl-tRNA(Ser) seleniumtransferase